MKTAPQIHRTLSHNDSQNASGVLPATTTHIQQEFRNFLSSDNAQLFFVCGLCVLRPKNTTYTEVVKLWRTAMSSHEPHCHMNQRQKSFVWRKTTFALNDRKTSLSIRVWLRVHTEIYTEVKQLGSGGRHGFSV